MPLDQQIFLTIQPGAIQPKKSLQSLQYGKNGNMDGMRPLPPMCNFSTFRQFLTFDRSPIMAYLKCSICFYKMPFPKKILGVKKMSESNGIQFYITRERECVIRISSVGTVSPSFFAWLRSGFCGFSASFGFAVSQNSRNWLQPSLASATTRQPTTS